MNKSCNCVNLSLVLHVASIFSLGSSTSGTFFYILLSHHINLTWETSLEDAHTLAPIIWCKTDICSCKLSAKAPLMLDNLFPAPSSCKLNHIRVCFIQISKKVTCKQVISSRKSNVFLKSFPVRCFRRSVNFNITEISIKTARVFIPSVSCDYYLRMRLLFKFAQAVPEIFAF